MIITTPTPDPSPLISAFNLPGNVPTGADAIAWIRSQSDLSEGYRAVLISSINKLAVICGVPVAAMPMQLTFFNDRLFRKRPGIHGLAKDSFNTLVSNLRFVMRGLGVHPSPKEEEAQLRPDCQALLDEINRVDPVHGKFRCAGVIGPLRYLSMMGIPLDQVTERLSVDYAAWRRANILHRDPVGSARKACADWNRAVLMVRGLPQTKLRPGRRAEQYTLPPSTYPPALRADREDFLRRSADDEPGDLYPDDLFLDDDDLDQQSSGSGGRARPPHGAKPRTVQTRGFQIDELIAGMVHSGHSLETMDGLRCLVVPFRNLCDSMNHNRGRARQKMRREAEIAGGEQAVRDLEQKLEYRRPRTSHLAGLAEVARQIAKFHVGLPEREVAKIAELARKVAPPKGRGLTRKNRERLRALRDTAACIRLIHLPQHLMKLADKLMKSADDLTKLGKDRAANPHRLAAGRLARTAAAIEVWLICPLRITNMHELRLDLHLGLTGSSRQLITYIVIPEEETKNDNPIEWPVPPESAVLLRTYMTRYRPLQTGPTNRYLFPGSKVDGPISVNALREAVEGAIAELVGVELNPHLLRHFAAWLHLRAYPGDYETVRRVLGHKDINTTIQYYVGLEVEFAARKFDSVVLQARSLTQKQAVGAYRQARPSRLAKRGA